jgi:hypothetical protein
MMTHDGFLGAIHCDDCGRPVIWADWSAILEDLVPLLPNEHVPELCLACWVVRMRG